MNNVVILLGGNLGRPIENFIKSKQQISEAIGAITNESSIYESSAWGFEAKELFLNQVIIVESNLKPFELLKATQNIEQSIGRKNKTIDLEYSSRLIDIDILFYNDDIIQQPNLSIPHPRLHLRNFTLEPLNEILPNFVHPILKKEISTLLRNSPDQAECKKLNHEKT